jgi:hypothetical protein
MRIVSFAFKDERSPLNEAAYVRCHRGAVRLLFLLSTAINPARRRKSKRQLPERKDCAFADAIVDPLLPFARDVAVY